VKWGEALHKIQDIANGEKQSPGDYDKG
jgi:hypothetical protein